MTTNRTTSPQAQSQRNEPRPVDTGGAGKQEVFGIGGNDFEQYDVPTPLFVEPPDCFKRVPDRYRFSLPDIELAPESLAQGGFGTVYEARIIRGCLQQKLVAGKVYHNYRPDIAVEEFEKLLKLEHRTIVRAIGLIVDPWNRKIVTLTELASCTVADMMDDLHKNANLMCTLMLDVIDAVEWMHSKTDERSYEVALHLDLKPSNVLVFNSGIRGPEAKLADLGTCRLSAETTQMSQTQYSNIGTPPYMAPEQWDDDFGKLSSKTDVYSVCVMLWELITNKKPFDGLKRQQILWRLTIQRRGLEQIHVDDRFSPTLVEVVNRGILLEPRDRCTLNELRAGLQAQQKYASAPLFRPAEPPRSHLCPICYEAMTSVMNLAPCNHKLCSSCAARLLESTKKCPQCRELVITAAKDHSMSNMLSEVGPQLECQRCHHVIRAADRASHRCGEVLVCAEPAKGEGNAARQPVAYTVVAGRSVDEIKSDIVQASEECTIVAIKFEENSPQTDALLSFIAERSPSLSSLDVSQKVEAGECGSTGDPKQITDLSIGVVAEKCRELRVLNIRHTGGITDDSIIPVIRSCSKLASLDVSYTGGRVTNATMFAIADYCTNLTSLDISYTGTQINDNGLIAVARKCRQLTTLSVTNTQQCITNPGILAIAENCPLLESLNIQATRGAITDEAIIAVANNCPRLRFLNVRATRGGITNASIVAIATKCPAIEFLNCRCTDGKVTDESILVVADRCKMLRSLDVSYTDGKVTDASIKEVAMKCLALESLAIVHTNGKITPVSLTLFRDSCTIIMQE